MKSLLVIAALLAAGCSAATKEAATENPLPPGYVTLSTFTADVDTVAGTFVIRSEPVAGARMPGMSQLVIVDPTEVTVANNGASWFNDPTEKGCGSVPTWGANVTVTNKIASPTSLAGVYAEITSFGGASGTESCNKVVIASTPAGMSNTYGLWSYGTLQPATGAASTNWTFNYTTATRFSFSGRIVGVKVDSYQSLPSSVRTSGGITAFGSYMVYGSNGNGNLAYVSASTGALADEVATAPSSASIVSTVAGDATNDRVWFGSQQSAAAGYIGVVSKPGHVVYRATVDNAAPYSIVIDPTNSSMAWYRSVGLDYIRSATYDSGTDTVAINPTFTGTGSGSQAMAMGPGGNLYLSFFNDGIYEYTTNSSTGVATFVKNYPNGVNCGGLGDMLWVASKSTLFVAANGSGFICAVTFTGTGSGRTATWTPVVHQSGASNSRQMVWGPSGRAFPNDYALWVTNLEDNTVLRVDPDGTYPEYTLTMPVAMGSTYSGPAMAALSSTGEIWTTNNVAVFRIHP